MKSIRYLLQPLAFILILATGALRTQAAPTSVANTFHTDNNFAILTEWEDMRTYSLQATSNGGFLVGGTFSMIGDQRHSNLAKFRSDGTVDPAFNQDTRFDGLINAITFQQDGRILVGGEFLSVNNTDSRGIARLNADGSHDTGFNPGTGFVNTAPSASPYGIETRIVVQTDGRILVSGLFTEFNGTPRRHIARLNANGTLDTGFNPGANLGGDIVSIALQADGKILVGGYFTNRVVGTPRKNVLVRLNADGTVDNTFSFDPGDNDGSAVEAIAVQPDGKILVGGILSGFDAVSGVGCIHIMRLNANGTRDTSFNTATSTGTGAQRQITSSVMTDKAYHIALESDGRILAGSYRSFRRLNTDGSNNTSLNLGAEGNDFHMRGLALLTDGRIAYSHDYGIPRRRTSTGAVDPISLGTPRSLAGGNLARISGNKIILAGGFTWLNGVPASNRIVCFNSNGTIDPTFNANTVFTPANPSFHTLAVQADERLVITGTFTQINQTPYQKMARLNSNGTLDTSFNIGTGPADYIMADGSYWPAVLYATAVQANGQIISGGWFGSFNSASRIGLVRLNSNGSVDPTFNPGTGFEYTDYNINFTMPGIPLDICPQADGKLIVTGFFNTYNGATCNKVVRLNANGTLDNTFNSTTGGTQPAPAASDDDGVFAAADTSGGYSTDIKATVTLPDGRTIIAGDFTTIGGTVRNRIARLNTNGTLDTTFNPGTGFNDTVSSLLLQPDGRVIVGGYFTTFNGTASKSLVRLNTDGTLDTRFGIDLSSCVHGVNITDEGKILVTEAVSRLSRQVDGYTLLVPDVAPVITTQPTSTTVTAGSSATLTAAASGEPTPTFQWFRGTTALTGRTSATLSLTNVQTSDAGSYTVVATNSAGSATSNAATLTVNVTPAITTQPASASVTVGGSATLTAAASGTPAPTFQWYRGTTALTGRTSATLSLTNVQASDAGSYTIVATNTAGSATSNIATLTVTSTPPADNGGGGGGGAPGGWFLTALASAYIARLLASRRKM